MYILHIFTEKDGWLVDKHYCFAKIGCKKILPLVYTGVFSVYFHVCVLLTEGNFSIKVDI